MGAADFVPVYLATFLQRTAFDCHRVHRAGRLRGLLLAEPGDSVCRAHCGFAYPMGRIASGELDCDAGDCAGNRYLLFHDLAAVSADHGDRSPVESIVAGRDGNDWMGHLRRADALQRGSCLRFSSGRVHALTRILHRVGRSHACGHHDYWGYYNVCYLGDEIKDPTRNIPRALLLSILLVACLYLMMNLCILAVIPW